MEVGQKFLVIRFGTNINSDCIAEHLNVIASNGACWFGKIGVVPSKKAIEEVKKACTPKLLLYTKNHAYECDFCDVMLEKPDIGYPSYYETELFEKGIYPKSYFKLTSIVETPIAELTRYVVVSSRNALLDTLNKSMSSFFFAEYPDRNCDDGNETSVSSNRRNKDNKKHILPSNECKYKKEKRCTLKSCINYGYECERPSMCLKQKR